MSKSSKNKEIFYYRLANFLLIEKNIIKKYQINKRQMILL